MGVSTPGYNPVMQEMPKVDCLQVWMERGCMKGRTRNTYGRLLMVLDGTEREQNVCTLQNTGQGPTLPSHDFLAWKSKKSKKSDWSLDFEVVIKAYLSREAYNIIHLIIGGLYLQLLNI